MTEPTGAGSGAQRFAAAVWLAAALAVLSFPLYALLRAGGNRPPEAPIDVRHPHWGRQWELVAAAEPLVPEWSAYAVRSSRPASEMTLFQFSVDVMRRRRPIPPGSTTTSEGFPPDYVVTEGCIPVRLEGYAIAARLPGGCLWKRVP